MFGKGNTEGIGVGTQLLDESVLDIGAFVVSSVGGNLSVDDDEFLAEAEAHHLVLLTAMAEGDPHTGEHPPSSKVIIVHNNHTIHGGGVVDVVHEVPTS